MKSTEKKTRYWEVQQTYQSIKQINGKTWKETIQNIFSGNVAGRADLSLIPIGWYPWKAC